MTVVSGSTTGIARDKAASVTFVAPLHRSSVIAGGVVSIRAHDVEPDEFGVVTSPNLEPGPVVVTIEGKKYSCLLPDQPSITLADLIAAAAPLLPPTPAEIIQAAVDAYMAAHFESVEVSPYLFSIPGSGVETSPYFYEIVGV